MPETQSKTDQENSEIPPLVQEIKDDPSKALRDEKDLGDSEHPDAEHVDDPRTAIRFDRVEDGVPLFDGVTTRLIKFPVGKDDTLTATQKEVSDWVRRNDPEVISVEEEQWEGL